jgi:predicted membrane protein
MLIRIDRFFFDEKDIFVFLFGVFLILSFILKIPTYPFRFSSLIVVFLFLLVTRSLISQAKFNSYLYIALSGLLFSLFLSPYGLAIYFFIAIIIYNKTNLI